MALPLGVTALLHATPCHSHLHLTSTGASVPSRGGGAVGPRRRVQRGCHAATPHRCHQRSGARGGGARRERCGWGPGWCGSVPCACSCEQQTTPICSSPLFKHTRRRPGCPRQQRGLPCEAGRCVWPGDSAAVLHHRHPAAAVSSCCVEQRGKGVVCWQPLMGLVAVSLVLATRSDPSTLRPPIAMPCQAGIRPAAVWRHARGGGRGARAQPAG
jgi:hypothetical protein